jgi:hypothetical protein
MNASPDDLRARLRDADPVAAESALSPNELARMRRTIVAATLPAAAPVRRSRPRATLALAAILTIAAAAGAVSARRYAALRMNDGQLGATIEASAAARTQVQFATPGGTRIIWTFDPAFQLRETTR